MFTEPAYKRLTAGTTSLDNVSITTIACSLKY
jgi:hypothetical protein